jgi:hypothetical protein
MYLQREIKMCNKNDSLYDACKSFQNSKLNIIIHLKCKQKTIS